MPVVEIDQLHKRYGDRVAVDDVSLSVEEGEIVGVLGPNGAGKTTTAECVSGLRSRDSGELTVLGVDPGRRPEVLRGQVGVQLQESAMPDRLRVGEALDLWASLYPEPADPGALIERLGLGHRRDTAFARLSGGERQRLSVALALVGRPRLAILDELATGLDPRGRRDVWALVEEIRREGVTVLLVTHLMEEAERLCDRVAVLREGRVVALDTPAGLAERTAGETRLRFRPAEPLRDGLLEELDAVQRIDARGDQLVVHGGTEVVAEVTAALARAGVVAHDLRVDQVGLEQAYLELTGDGDPSPAEAPTPIEA